MKDTPTVLSRRRPGTAHTVTPTSENTRYDDFVTNADLLRVYNTVKELETTLKGLENNVKELQNRYVGAPILSFSSLLTDGKSPSHVEVTKHLPDPRSS